VPDDGASEDAARNVGCGVICIGCGLLREIEVEADPCPNCGLASMDMTPFLLKATRELLAQAYEGLKWYRDMHPEDDSPADDELYGRIERALKA